MFWTLTFERVERPDTPNVPETFAVAAENVETSPLEENRLTELSVFWTLTFESVDIPDTLNAPEILAVTAERVLITPFEENKLTALIVFVTFTFERVERAETLKVATDKVVTVPIVEMMLEVVNVFVIDAPEIVASPQMFSVVFVSVPDTDSVVAERVVMVEFDENRKEALSVF